MSKNSNMTPPRRRDVLSLAAAGVATALPVPLSARDRIPEFGPCSGFVASALRSQTTTSTPRSSR